jgi:small subunit ribosomal protein S16
MATSMRLLRTGTTGRPFYRLVVIDQARANKGGIIENLGMVPVMRATDLPKRENERITHWLSMGAIVSPSAKTVLKKAGLLMAVPPTKSIKKAKAARAAAKK